MAETKAQIQRPFANFSPSLWGDQFIKHSSNSDAQVAENLSKIVEELKNEVRGMIAAPAGIKLVDTMGLIDTLERLGVSYHFKNEIEEILQQLFNLKKTDYNDEAYDLYTVALHFRLFRQHGYPISSEIFGRWMDVNGEFQEILKTDAKGLLSLYEASYLRTHGETILDGALDFATASLKSIAPHLEPPLRKQVVHALVRNPCTLDVQESKLVTLSPSMKNMKTRMNLF